MPDNTITAVTHFDQDCYRFPECVDMENPQSGSCATNFTRVGHDQDVCGNSGVSPAVIPIINKITLDWLSLFVSFHCPGVRPNTWWSSVGFFKRSPM